MIYRQWGINSSPEKLVRINYPVSYSYFCSVIVTENDSNNSLNYRCCVGGYTLTYLNQVSTRADSVSFNRIWFSLGA